MKRYFSIMCGMFAFFLSLCFLVKALGVPLLVDPTPSLNHGGPWAAMLGVGLLLADVVLPVPSSLIMVAHGALFGVVGGTLLSLTGSVGAAMLGFWLGRRGGRLLERLLTPEERERADGLLKRWGTLAIIVTRPVPLLAETVAIMAGASGMSPGRAALAAVTGSLPPALLYALTGAAAAKFENAALVFGLVVLVAGCFWLIGRTVEPYLARRRARS
ncbi:MAG: TVP38/TMEM64 family protein [Pyrinomonadaceae bacterium]|nr:TVP38/TMEM64 family protein [Pyrinomonadaceae bacterium]